MSQPDWYPAGPAWPGQVPVLDTKLDRIRLYADPQVIAYGRDSIALDQVEWVSYWATQTATKRLLYPTTHDSEWDFEVGRYPYYAGPRQPDGRIAVRFWKAGRRDGPPEEWTFLVNLARQYLEPRLLTDLVTRVRRGETVKVGGVMVSQGGIACGKPRLSLPWGAISVTQPYGGMVWIYQAGVENPVLSMPLSYPNAGLIPALFATLMS
jgi:hypothetical protein